MVGPKKLDSKLHLVRVPGTQTKFNVLTSGNGYLGWIRLDEWAGKPAYVFTPATGVSLLPIEWLAQILAFCKKKTQVELKGVKKHGRSH
jgi:hypothetical protein